MIKNKHGNLSALCRLALVPLAFFITNGHANLCCPPETGAPRIAFLSSIYENPCIDFFRGFYVGANVGYRWGFDRLKIEGETPPDLQRNMKSQLTTIFRAGYGHVYEILFLGIEAGYEYRSLEQSTTYTSPVFNVFEDVQPVFPPLEGVPVTTTIRAQHAATLDFLPGFVITPRTLLYARFGVEYSRFTWSRRFSVIEFLLNQPGIPPRDELLAREFRDTDSETNHGARLGLGIARAVTQHVSVDINYIYSIANNLIFQKTRDPIETEGSLFGLPVALDDFVRAKNTIRPNRNEVNIGLTFRF